MSNEYYLNKVHTMATDDECALTHVPGTRSPYYGTCPDCGLTPPMHSKVLGEIAVLGIGTLLVLGAGLYVVSSIIGAGFSKGKQFIKA